VIIRYNPDSYKINGRTRKTNKQVRHDKLIETIKKYSKVSVEKYSEALRCQFKRIRLFYDNE